MAERNVYLRRVVTHDSTELCNKSSNMRAPLTLHGNVTIYLCVTVSLTIPPACQLVKYIVAIMKLFAYNDNTHKISPPKGALQPTSSQSISSFFLLRLFCSVQCCCCQSVSQVCSNNSRLVPVLRYNLVPAVLILN